MAGPKEVASILHVSPATLRRWSVQFVTLLSERAGQAIQGSGGGSQRDYAPADIELLHQVKALLSRGLTTEEAHAVLTGQQLEQVVKAQEARIQALTHALETLSAEKEQERERLLGVIKRLLNQRKRTDG